MRSPLTIVLLTGALIAAMSRQAKAQPQSYSTPGQMIDIGGRKLHLYCTGKGAPTVILIAGGGGFSIDWALVQPKVAEQTRVCSYDRAGLGWSDPGPAEETVEETVNDLHSLLHTSSEKGPFILVGASIGGVFSQAYQRTFPADVDALVFSNSANRVGFKGKDKAGLLWELTEADLRSAFPLPTSMKNPMPTREDDPYDRLPPELQKVRLWFDVRLWEKSDPAKATPDSLPSWRKEFLKEFDETEPGKKPPLGTLPIVVVSSNPPATDANRHSRDEAGPRLDFLSSNTLHITATGSGHEIHLYQPDHVVEGVLQAITAVRSGHPLAHP